MKALSIRQPWAFLIVNGFKHIENRDWPTKFRGPLLIHASGTMTKADYWDCMDFAGQAVKKMDIPAAQKKLLDSVTMESLKAQMGGIVGKAHLVDCVSAHPSVWFFGKYGFVMQNAEPLPFRPYKGQLGFFEVKDEIAH